MGGCCSSFSGGGESLSTSDAGLPKERFTVIKKLGSGAEGELYLMKDKTRDQADQLVAVKLIKRGSLVDETRVFREILLQSQLNHIHVIKLFQIILTDSHFCIVMEFAKGGDLFHYITKKIKPVSKYQAMSEDEARYIFHQILSAVDYCHKRRVAHRDLKLANILLDDKRPPRVKICDFGLSRSYENEEKNLYTIVGTPAYMSPEVLDPKQNPDGYNPVKADIWSSGVILYAMLRGRFPFDTHQGNLKAVLRNIKAAHEGDPGHLWDAAWGQAHLSDEVKDLLDHMLDMRTESRSSISEIMAHPWFQMESADKFERAKAYTERAQEEWNKLSDIIGLNKQERLKKLVHEAMIDHGHPGEILEWHPPTSLRIRTEYSHHDLTELVSSTEPPLSL